MNAPLNAGLQKDNNAREWGLPPVAQYETPESGGRTKITTLETKRVTSLRKGLDTRSLTQIAVFAALYAVLVWLFQPISFAAVQFRVAEGLKPAIAKRWTLAIAFAIGNFLGNLISPFAGIYELGFMPLMNIVGGLLAYAVARVFRRNYLAAALVYAPVIALSVSWMLHALYAIPLEGLIPLLLASELIVMIGGSVIFQLVERRWKWYQ